MSKANYIIREDGCDFATIKATDADVALEVAEKEYADCTDYDTSGGTIWITWHAIDSTTGERLASRKITIDPPEPECTHGEHDWQSPYEFFGGLRENPGVWGHGGGVTIQEACMHCGCERKRDTWAQDPSDGEQGLESVQYERGRWADEVRALREECEQDDGGDNETPWGESGSAF